MAELMMTAPVEEPLVEQRMGGPLADLRNAKYLPIEEMQAGLTEFVSRRRAFREWLMSVLVPGVHYGTVPGCEPKFDKDGNLTQWSKDKVIVIGKDQWRWRPSFYKSGAELLCELFNWRPKFEHDLVTWEMLGKPKAFCCVCHLINQLEMIVGEGRGARDAGQKGGNTNNVIKMGQKCAQVDAIIRTLAISDLFTQDEQNEAPNAQPDANPDAVKSQPRSTRISEKDLRTILDLWKSNNHFDKPEEGKVAWIDYCCRLVGRDFNALKWPEWTREDWHTVRDAINQELDLEDGPPPF